MAQAMTRYEALLSLVEQAGSQSALARALGVSQPAVWFWLNQSKRLPAEYVIAAEEAFGVSRHDLRPDIYPREVMRDAGKGRFLGVDLETRKRAA